MAEQDRIFMDTSEGVDWVERYAAFLQLQNEASGLTDQEYLERLALIDGTGAFQAGEFGYTDAELGNLSDAERLAILEAQEETEREGQDGQKRVMQFGGGTVPASETDAGMNVLPPGGPVLETEDVPQGGPQDGDGHEEPAAGTDDGAQVLADGTVLYPNGTEDAGDQETRDDPDASDPGLDIVYGDGPDGGTVLAAGAAAGKEDGEKDEAEEDGPEAAQSQPDEPEQDMPVTAPAPVLEDDEDGMDGPGKEAQLGWAPAGGVPDFEAGAYPEPQLAPEGHVVVSEQIQINDWLDEIGAGMGLVSGVQTAEYIPPEPQARPQQLPQAQPVRSEAMKQLDRMVERVYGPETGGGQKEAEGPTR